MTDPHGTKKRVTVKRPHPNPQIHEFLMSLREEAVRVNSSLLPNLEEAITSFAKYPLPLTSAADCAILKGFNKKLCNYIESRLNGASKKNKLSKSEESKTEGESYKYSESSNVNFDNLDSDINMASNSIKNKKNKNKPKNAQVKSNKNNINMKTDKDHSSSKSKNKQGATNSNYLAIIVPSTSKDNKDEDKTNTKSDEIFNNNNNSNMNTEPIASTSGYNQSNAKQMNELIASKNKKGVGKKSKKTIPATNEYYRSDLLDKLDSLLTYHIDKSTKEYSVNLTTTSPKLTAQKADCKDNNKKENDFPQTNDTPVINLVDEIEECPDYFQIEEKSIENNANEIINFNDDADDEGCLECSNIAEAANAFEISFKEKMKKDTEKVRKCVLPRKLYLPEYRTPSYALVIALYEQGQECPYRDSLTKEELIQKAQKHTDTLFKRPESGPVSKLVMKGMIEIVTSGGEDYYKLTIMGKAVALELVQEDSYKKEKDKSSDWPCDRVPVLQNLVRAPAPVPPDEGLSPEPVFIEMPPGTFEIILLIDKHEHSQPSRLHKCRFELRSLTVGDFLWIARSKKTGQELVLPYIVERKRMDDLASSIKDGRFHEQKFRLKKSGLENVIYLIESHGKNKHLGLPLPTLKQAIVNTSVQDDFMVVNTESLIHTFKMLAKFTEKLVHDFSLKHLRGCNRDTRGKELMTFEYFNKASCKNKPLTVKETFIKMLLQLKGLSVEKALAITNKYDTPKVLMKAYDKCTEKEGELLLASLKYNNFSKNVGPAVSKTIYQLFSKMQL